MEYFANKTPGDKAMFSGFVFAVPEAYSSGGGITAAGGPLLASIKLTGYGRVRGSGESSLHTQVPITFS